MAVPTISSVSPTTGLTRGINVVYINGTNFRLPPTVTTYDPGDAQQTVKVTFGGVDATEAHAISAIKAMAIAPAWTGSATADNPGAVDVRIANLDDAGAEISGENATLASAYTYTRATLTAETTIQRVIRELIRVFRRRVHKNTHITMSSSYDDSVADDLDRIKRAELPLILIKGPDVTGNERLGKRAEDEIVDPGDSDMYIRKHVPITVDLSFNVQFWADERNVNAIFALTHNTRNMIRQGGYLYIYTDPRDQSLGETGIDWIITDEQMGGFDLGPQFDGLRLATLSFDLIGVDVDDVGGTIVERGWNIYTDDYDIDIEAI
jgi:hypothetical protein